MTYNSKYFLILLQISLCTSLFKIKSNYICHFSINRSNQTESSEATINGFFILYFKFDRHNLYKSHLIDKIDTYYVVKDTKLSQKNVDILQSIPEDSDYNELGFNSSRLLEKEHFITKTNNGFQIEIDTLHNPGKLAIVKTESTDIYTVNKHFKHLPYEYYSVISENNDKAYWEFPKIYTGTINLNLPKFLRVNILPTPILNYLELYTYYIMFEYRLIKKQLSKRRGVEFDIQISEKKFYGELKRVNEPVFTCSKITDNYKTEIENNYSPTKKDDVNMDLNRLKLELGWNGAKSKYELKNNNNTNTNAIKEYISPESPEAVFIGEQLSDVLVKIYKDYDTRNMQPRLNQRICDCNCKSEYMTCFCLITNKTKDAFGMFLYKYKDLVDAIGFKTNWKKTTVGFDINDKYDGNYNVTYSRFVGFQIEGSKEVKTECLEVIGNKKNENCFVSNTMPINDILNDLIQSEEKEKEEEFKDVEMEDINNQLGDVIKIQMGSGLDKNIHEEEKEGIEKEKNTYWNNKFSKYTEIMKLHVAENKKKYRKLKDKQLYGKY